MDTIIVPHLTPSSHPLGHTDVSVYRGSRHPRPVATRSLWHVLDAIRDGAHQPPVQRLRELLRTDGREAYNVTKRTLDAFTPCGTFFPTRAKAHLCSHSRIVHGDLDHLEDVQAVKQHLTADPHLVYCFVSPSGAGLKLGIRIDPVGDDTAYKRAWQAVAEAHQQAYGMTWDPSGKDVSRLCYVSWDRALYRNLNAQPFPVPDPAPPAERPRASRVTCDLPHHRRERYAQRALRAAVAMIDASTPGNRHHHRLKASYLLGGYVAGGILREEEAYAVLAPVVARHTAHLERSLKTIADGLRDGQERPITLEDLEAERRDWLAQRPRHLRANAGSRASYRGYIGYRGYQSYAQEVGHG